MRLGVAQMFITDTLPSNEAAIVEMAKTAAARGVKLLAFPEMSLTGYNPDTLGRASFTAEVNAALGRIAEQAVMLGMGLIVGHASYSGGGLYNAASVLLPDGTTHIYHKIHLTAAEAQYFSPGTAPLTFTLQDHTFGVIICRDQNDPQLARRLCENGAETIFILAAHYYPASEARWKLPKNRALPIARAVENGVYVLLANAVGSHLGMVSLGNSLIADPDGAVIAAAGESGETMLTCDLPDRR